MWSIKGLLLAAPTVVSLFLLQSYFWVPTFEDQARGDPGRLTRFRPVMAEVRLWDLVVILITGNLPVVSTS